MSKNLLNETFTKHLRLMRQHLKPVLNEGRMKDLAMDLEELSDDDFKRKYGKTKSEIKASLGMNETATTNDGGDENIKMAQSDVTNIIDYSEKLQSLFDANDNLEDWVKAKLNLACDYVVTVRDYLKFYDDEQEKNTQNIEEKWSNTYKKSISCSNPKGFSQKAHCAARRKRRAGGTTSSKSVKECYTEAVLEILQQQDSSMSMGALKQLNSDAKELETMLQNTNKLEDWVKAKLTMAGTNLQSVFGYLNHAAKTNGQHDADCDDCDDCDDCMQDVNQQSLTELAGIAPVIGQNKYDYVVTTLYKGSNSQTVKSLSPIFASDEAEAKEIATAPYNRSVVTIVSVKVTNVGSVTQADVDAYNKGVKGTYDSIRRFGTTD